MRVVAPTRQMASRFVLALSLVLVSACWLIRQPGPKNPLGQGELEAFDVNAARSQYCANEVGRPDKKQPIVCVFEDSMGNIQVNPEPVYAYRKHNGKPVKIRWLTKSQFASLDVDFRDSGCVEPETCYKEDGNCEADTVTTGEGMKECKYDVILSGRRWDPRVIIDDAP